MVEKQKNLSSKSISKDVKQFLNKVASTPMTTKENSQGRLIFALDATASRQPLWDQAAQIQGEMFIETSLIGCLEIQLSFFRGFGEFKASPWLSDSNELLSRMTNVSCLAGETQISKVLNHSINETIQSVKQPANPKQINPNQRKQTIQSAKQLNHTIHQ